MPIDEEGVYDSPKVRGRRWWIAGLLGLLAPGVGQIYNGQRAKGLIFYILFRYHSIPLVLLFVSLALPPFYINVFIPFAIIFYIIIDGIIFAAKRRASYQLKKYNKVYQYLIMIAVSWFLLVPTVRSSVVKAYRIPYGDGSSMEDGILEGDFLLGTKFNYGAIFPYTRSSLVSFLNRNGPKPGDIIFYQSPEDPGIDCICRCVATEGQKVEIADKNVYVNDELLVEP